MRKAGFIWRATREDDAHERVTDLRENLRLVQLDLARQFAALEHSSHYVFDGAASIGEYGENHGFSAREARQFAAVGKALEASPELAERILTGRISFESAAIIAKVILDPTLVRDDEDWLLIAEMETAWALSRRVHLRIEEARTQKPAIELTLYVSQESRDDFSRARILASRKAKRALSPGEAFETVVGHYLDDFDAMAKSGRERRVPHTAIVPGRYVPAEVKRDVSARTGDRCAVRGCDHDIFLEFAHREAHADGGNREAGNLDRLCWRHHAMFDAGILDAGQIEREEGRDGTGTNGARSPP
jgi:hypothetical protein